MKQRTVLMSLRKSSLVTALLSVAFITSAQRISFPGRDSESKSPNGNFVIQNLDYDDRDPAHVLVLVDTKTGTKTKIHSYDRHVDLLWSPQSNALVINDYEGSDSTRPLLFLFPWTGDKLDLLEKLTDFMRSRNREDRLHKNDHSSLTVQRWINSHELLCQLEAYGGGSRFRGYYVYTIGQGFRAYDPKDGTK